MLRNFNRGIKNNIKNKMLLLPVYYLDDEHKHERNEIQDKPVILVGKAYLG